MINKFDDMQTAPVLTLEPFREETELIVEEKAELQIKEPELTPEEQAMVDSFAGQINLNNSNMILQYGAATQKKMADFSEIALEKVRSKDLGEVGELLTDVIA